MDKKQKEKHLNRLFREMVVKKSDTKTREDVFVLIEYNSKEQLASDESFFHFDDFPFEDICRIIVIGETNKADFEKVHSLSYDKDEGDGLIKFDFYHNNTWTPFYDVNEVVRNFALYFCTREDFSAGLILQNMPYRTNPYAYLDIESPYYRIFRD